MRSTQATPRSRAIHEPQEVQFPHRYHRIPGIYINPNKTPHGPNKGSCDPELARTAECPQHAVVPQVCELYHCFIADYSQLTLLLTNLCKITTPWIFGEMETTTFQTLKNAFSTAPVLCHWAPDLQMCQSTCKQTDSNGSPLGN